MGRTKAGRTRAVGYVRVSTTGQADDGVSLAEQTARVEAYARAFDLELVRVEVDAGVSAGTLRRAGLDRALRTLRSGRADALVVCALSRLTRSVRDLGQLLDDYFASGRWSLLSIGENVDTRTASGRLCLSVLGAVSAWEREANAERTSAAMRHLAEVGRFGGGTEAPYGYRLAGDGRMLEPVPGEQLVVREAAELRARGFSLREVAARLARRGHVSRRGKVFDSTQVRTMLRRHELVAGAGRNAA